MRRFNYLLYIVFSAFCLALPRIAAADSIAFCRPNNMVSALSYIADTKGYFRDAGLDVRFEEVTNAKLCNDSLIAGRADISNGGDGPFAFIAHLNPPIKVIASLMSVPETSVTARRDRGISSPADLAGKRIGYLPATVSFLYLARLFRSLNLEMSAATLVPLQPPAMPFALAGGQVDAVVMWEPWSDQAAKRLGANGVTFRDAELYSYRGLLIAGNETIETRGAEIRKVLRAMLRAETFIKDSPREAVEILSKRISMDAELLSRLLPEFVFRVSWSSEVRRLLEDDFALLQAHEPSYRGVKSPDFGPLIDVAALRDVAPERLE